MIRPPIRHLALVTAAGALLAACDVGPQIAGYRTLTVEPTAQLLDWQNPVYFEYDAQLKAKAVLGSYYWVFTNAQGGTQVEHAFQRDAASPRVRLSYLETNLTDHVIRVVRGGPQYIVAAALYGADGRGAGISRITPRGSSGSTSPVRKGFESEKRA